MTLTQLETLAAVIEQRSFTAAARRLGISQSGVSHAITSLETELGVSLLERDRKRLTLSPVGEALYPHAHEMLRQRDLLLQQATAARGLKQGRLVIGSFGQSASIKLLPPLIASFKQRYPNVSVSVQEGAGPEIIEWLHQRRVDAGFVVLPNDDLDTVFVTADRLIALLPVGHALAKRPTVSLAELAAEPFILSAAGSRPLIERAFRGAGLTPDTRYKIQQINSIINFVQHGLGVTIIAELALPEQLPSGVRAKPIAPELWREIGLAMRRSDASPAVQALLRLVEARRAELIAPLAASLNAV